MYAQTSLQKRVEKQKEHANRNLTGWFLRKFSKKTQYLRDQDEESAQADRMRRHTPTTTSSHSQSGHSTSGSSHSGVSHAKPRHISAVAAAASARYDSNSDKDRPTPQQQRTFLRTQLLEMKRESAETLLVTQQKRMAGEVVVDVPRFGTQLGIDNSDDEDYALDESDDDNDSVCSVNELDDALQELSAAEFRAIRKEKWLRHQTKTIESAVADAAAATTTTRKDRAGSGQRRSSTASSQGTRDGDESDKENDAAAASSAAAAFVLNRRISRATQMYKDALSEIDHALHPTEHAPLEPQPLYLGAKKASNRPKSEWI